MNFNIFGSSAWSITNLAAPWQNRPSIYWHILNHLQDDACGLKEGGEELPDEKLVRGDSEIGWAAGALDGVFGHHGGSDEAVSKKARRCSITPIWNWNIRAPISTGRTLLISTRFTNCRSEKSKNSSTAAA